MKYWILVEFTGFDGSQRQGDIAIWSDYKNSGHVYDSPAYKVIATCDTFKEALAYKRHALLHKKWREKFVADKIVWQLPSEVPASNKVKIAAWELKRCKKR